MEIQINSADPRFPIGKYKKPAEITSEDRILWINELEELPALLRKALWGLNDKQLDSPYREGGWTLRQVVHHLPDSHLNGFIRMKLALTEDHPTIKPYPEDLFANLEDYRQTPLEISLSLLENLHKRWVILLRTLTEKDWERTYVHPELNQVNRLDESLSNYAWHGKHHLGHILSLKQKMNW